MLPTFGSGAVYSVLCLTVYNVQHSQDGQGRSQKRWSHLAFSSALVPSKSSMDSVENWPTIYYTIDVVLLFLNNTRTAKMFPSACFGDLAGEPH